MPRKTPEERLQQLVAKQDAVKAQIANTRARIKQKERRKDTRRKIVVGAVALATAERDPEFAAQLDRLLNRYVERDIDRELFELPPKRQEAAS